MSDTDDISYDPPEVAATLSAWVTVRASIPLPDFPRGEHRLVNADDPYIQGMLGAGWLIPVGEPDELPQGE